MSVNEDESVCVCMFFNLNVIELCNSVLLKITDNDI